MKQPINFFVIVFAFSFCLISCNKISPDTKLSDNTTVFASWDGGTRTSLDQDDRVIWSSDDEIGAFGNSKVGVDAKPLLFTLVSGAGTTGGVFTASSTFAKGSNEYYFFYPYNENVRVDDSKNLSIDIPSVQMYKANTFAEGSNIAVGITDDLEEGFTMKNVFGMIELKLKGDKTLEKIIAIAYDMEGNPASICGKALINAEDQSITFDAVDDVNNSVTLDCSAGKCKLSTTEATNFYFQLPPATYSKLTFIFYATDGAVASKSASSVLIERSKIKPMEEFSPKFVMLSYGKANSIIATSEAGEITIDATAYEMTTIYYKDATKSNKHFAAKADWLWNDAGASFISNVSYDKASETITLTKAEGAGNAIIVLMDDSGDIIWNFHIWATENPVDELQWNENIWLDRDLGATTTEYNLGILGLLYQWGRPTPFAGSKSLNIGSESTAFANAKTIFVNSSFGSMTWKVDNAPVSLPNSQKNPMTYYQGLNMKWVSGTGYDNELWGNDEVSKTIFDPCPKGYKVPTFNQLNADYINTFFDKKDSNNGVYASEQVVGQYPDLAGVIVPHTGARNANGALLKPGEFYLFSSTSADDGHAKSKSYTGSNNDQSKTNNSKTAALALRCVKYQTTVGVDTE